MAEQHPLMIDRASAAGPDWATLTDRALDDVSRILRSEMHMFQTSMETAVEARINDVVRRLTTIIAMVCGAICILCALILLLHQWLPWWQSFGIVGLSTLAAGTVNHAAMKPSSQLSAPGQEMNHGRSTD
jgi:hypothetical protein